MTVSASIRTRGAAVSVSDLPACVSALSFWAEPCESKAVRVKARPSWLQFRCRRKWVNRPRVLLADDHRVVGEGLKRLLDDDFELVGIVEDGRAMVSSARQLQPDV